MAKEETLQEFLKPTLEFIALELTKELEDILIRKGNLKRTGGLVASVDFKINNSNLELIANDYFEFYASGRRPMARKVPISALLKWIKRYKIKSKMGKKISDNALAFAIQNSIYKKGIRKKTWLYDWLKNAGDTTEELIGEATLEYYAKLVSKLPSVVEIKIK